VTEMVKWECKVLPLKTKVRVDHFRAEKINNRKHSGRIKRFRERRMGLCKRSKYSPRRWQTIYSYLS